MNTQENLNNIVKFFFSLQLNLKMYHWLTTSYARHKASDELGGNLLPLVDKFVEVYIGKYKVKPILSSIKIEQEFMSDNGSEMLLLKSKKYLEEIASRLNPQQDSELFNIKDELLAEIENTIYLYQLK
jgi:DNA-binding ferritin-like protein